MDQQSINHTIFRLLPVWVSSCLLLVDVPWSVKVTFGGAVHTPLLTILSTLMPQGNLNRASFCSHDQLGVHGVGWYLGWLAGLNIPTRLVTYSPPHLLTYLSPYLPTYLLIVTLLYSRINIYSFTCHTYLLYLPPHPSIPTAPSPDLPITTSPYLSKCRSKERLGGEFG